ncbi:MAG: ABC transporter permease [Calditrichia bacterium]|nr:ABC transporter permease [Calditrichia bacterium]
MKIFLAMIRKEVLQIFHDKFMLRLMIIAPIMQLLVLGYALTFETKNVKTMICNLDKSGYSKDFLKKLDNNDRFDIISYTDNFEDLKTAIHEWDAKIGIYIPPDFAKKLNRKNSGQILVILDAVDGNQAMTAFGYLQQIAAGYSFDILPQHVKRNLIKNSGMIQVNTHFLFNPELRNEAYMVPGVVVLILTVITLLVGALGMVKEKENGTLEQLMVTPIKKYQLILGKQFPFLIYSFIEIIIILKLAEFVFNLHLAGSLITLYLIAFFFLFTTLGLGLLVSTVSTTQQQALFLAWFAMVVMIMFSGFFIPIENMPAWLQKFTYLNPMRYIMTAVREIYLKGTPLRYLWDQTIPLILLGGSIFSISVLKFSKKVG